MSVASMLARLRRTGVAVPEEAQLANNALRHLVGTLTVLLAAAVVYRTGHPDQMWPYVAIAGSLVPQVLLCGLALGDADRRQKLRVSARPSPVPLLASVALMVGAAVSAFTGSAWPPVAAGFLAAAGFGVAAAPASVAVARRR